MQLHFGLLEAEKRLRPALARKVGAASGREFYAASRTGAVRGWRRLGSTLMVQGAWSGSIRAGSCLVLEAAWSISSASSSTQALEISSSRSRPPLRELAR